ncbi:hypothetical protein O1611_g6882 [Lasiodiplodia mahajangana]|uniref:Uncharacterized protein n=1 Tax=Lasiodiplodia mahajangana TaxID=1108764 RepID=A0ACC2JH32_9PEZI|nr:hypothetical protein O1611_g6882 [Lasiodiplodia mahajangana]
MSSGKPINASDSANSSKEAAQSNNQATQQKAKRNAEQRKRDEEKAKAAKAQQETLFGQEFRSQWPLQQLLQNPSQSAINIMT